MKQQQLKQEDNTNYSFLLKCMTALTAAAIATAGIFAAISLTSTTTSLLLASTTTPIFPIAIAVIGLIFILPFLFNNNNTAPANRPVAAAYNNFGFYATPGCSTTASVYTNTHYHGHDNDTGTHVHGHDNHVNDSHVHGHDNHGNDTRVQVHSHH